MNDNIYFIVGQRRSGTSLCRSLLGSHPSIIIPPTDFDSFYYTKKWYNNMEELIGELKGDSKLSNWDIDWDILSKDIEKDSRRNYLPYHIYNNFFRKYQDKVHIIKRPTYERYHKRLKQIYPNIKYIYMLRDPRATIASRIYFKKEEHSIQEIVSLTKRWILFHKIHYDNIKSLSIKVRYEDLVTNTEEELKRICDFIGVDYNSNMIDFYSHWGLDENQSSFSKDIKNNTKIYTSSLNRWKEILTRREINTITRLTNDILKEEGYA